MVVAAAARASADGAAGTAAAIADSAGLLRIHVSCRVSMLCGNRRAPTAAIAAAAAALWLRATRPAQVPVASHTQWREHGIVRQQRATQQQ